MTTSKWIPITLCLALVAIGMAISAGAVEGEKTLCEKYGAALPKVVDDFVTKAAANENVDFFRKGKFKKLDVKKLKTNLVAFVGDAIGCPKKYKGRNMKMAHKGMKIKNSEFSAIASDLQAVLEAYKVAPEDVKTIIGAVATTAKDIIEVRE